jgi:glycosyltransferase involved in cell wall biosynthesis
VKISAVIITLDEEKNLGRALASVEWADEIVVVDSGSTDGTARVAEAAGARFIVREWPGFGKQKQFATDAAANDWIFSLDADEEVSAELRDEILALRSSEPAFDGFSVPRLSFYMGRAIRHGGWYPDRQTRLFDRRKARWREREIHESVALDGAAGKLRGDLRHFSVESAAHHHSMIGERYAPLSASQMFADGRRTSALRVAAAGPAAFIRSYFIRFGFLDGFAGFCIARFAAHHAFLKHLMLLELQNRT